MPINYQFDAGKLLVWCQQIKSLQKYPLDIHFLCTLYCSTKMYFRDVNATKKQLSSLTTGVHRRTTGNHCWLLCFAKVKYLGIGD